MKRSALLSAALGSTLVLGTGLAMTQLSARPAAQVMTAHATPSCSRHRCSSSPAPTPTPTTPTPTPTTPTSTPTTPTSTSTAFSCVTSSPSGQCGPYTDPDITTSNGYNTYAQNNCFSDPGCQQTMSANAPGDWQVSSSEPAGNTSVMTGPQIAQLFDNWCAAEGTWQNHTADNCGSNPLSPTPVDTIKSLTSDYTESMPHDAQTIAEAAYDIWTNYADDIMVWQDVVGRCNAGSYGSTTLATGVSIGGHVYDVHRYGGPGAEVIFVEEGAGGPGTCAQDPSGTVDIKGILTEAETLGIQANITLTEVTFAWEICSTGGSPENFAVSRYTLPASA